MPPTENEDESSQRDMTVFLAESRDRSSNDDGMSYGSIIDYESQRIKKTVLSTTVAELYSFMKCFGPCQFLRGLWMDLSGEVADHISTQNCLADWLTKSSPKADNLITAVKTGRLLNVDINSNFRTLMEHKAFMSTWCRALMHTREKNVSFLNALKISLSPASRKGPNHVMVVRISMDSENQDATKITSALVDSRIFSPMKMLTLTMSMVFLTISLSVSPSFLPVLWQCRHQGPLVSAESIGGRKTLLSTLSALRTAIMSLWLSPDTASIWNLTRSLWNQNDSQRRLTAQCLIQTPWSKWFQVATRKDDVPHFSSSSLAGDVFTGITRTSYQAREPKEDDEERLAMKKRRHASSIAPASCKTEDSRRSSVARIFVELACLIWWCLHTSMVWLQSNICLPTVCEKICKYVELFIVAT